MKKLYFLLLGMSYACMLSAQIQIKGIVTSSDKEQPLESVVVQVKNTDFFITTDKDGSYEITLSAIGSYDITSSRQLPEELSQQPTLIFSLDGFASVEKIVEKSGQLDVILPFLSIADRSQLPNSKTATSAIGVLGGHQLLQPYLAASWSGKITGLQTFNQDNRSVLLQLRANNTIASRQQPLIVMDGIWLNDVSLVDLVPDDIAYIEVLKGAASTAFYGSRGGNGVIKITSRRGKDLTESNSRVSFRTEFGFSQPTNSYALNAKTNREILSNSGAQPVLGNINTSNTFTEDLPALKDYQNDFLFQNGAFQAHYLSVENRSYNTNFLASAHRMEDVGILQFSEGYTRNSLRFNLDHQLNKKWEFCAAAAYTFANEDQIEQGSNGFLANTLLLTPIFDLSVPNEEDGSLYDWDIDNTGNSIINPLYKNANSDQNANTTRLLGNWTAKYQINEAWQLSYAALLNRVTEEQDFFIEKGFLSSVVPTPFSPLTTFGIENSNGGAIFQSQNTQQLFLSQADARFNKKLLGLNVEANLSFQYEEINRQSDSQQGENLVVASVRSLDNPQTNILTSSIEQEVVTYSGIAATRINYKEKYSFDGVFRQERSSLFGTDAANDYFYQMGLAYLLSKDIKIKGIQSLKLRLASGTAGIRPTFEQRFSDFRLQNGTVRKSILENTKLRPTLVEELEIGLEATFAKAFNLGFSYSQSTAKDQILLMPLSGGTGFEGQWQNAGTVSGKTYEADLDIDMATLFRVNLTGFRWNLRTLFSKTSSTITTLSVPSYSNNLYRLEEGYDLGTFYGNVFVTSMEQLATMENLDPQDYTSNELGYIVHKDLIGTANETPLLLKDENDINRTQIIGNATPDFRMNFSNSLSFKGLELYALLDWKKGGDLYNQSKQTLYGDSRHQELSELDIAASFYENLYDNADFNSHFVEDASYLMLRELSLSYTLNQPNLFNSAFERLQFSLIGRNLWTWTKYSGFHPDIVQKIDNQLFAIDNFQMPSRRMLTGSIKIVF